MPIQFRCSRCGQLLQTPDNSQGQQAKCPACGTVLVIPPPATPQSPQPTPSQSAPPYPSPAYSTPASSAPQPFGGEANPYQSTYDASGYDERSFRPESASIGPIRPTLIDMGEIFRQAWGVFRDQWPAALGVAALCIVVNFFLGQASNFFGNLLGVANADPVFVWFVVVVSWIASQLAILWINIGQSIFFLQLVRGRRTDVSDVFGGGPYLLRVLGASLLLWTIPGLVIGVCGYQIMTGGLETAPAVIVTGSLVYLVLATIIKVFFWPFQLLILDQDVGVFDSLRLSLEVTSGNRLTCLAIGAVTAVCGVIFALMTCMIGIFVVLPFVQVLIAVAYLGVTGQRIGSRFEP